MKKLFLLGIGAQKSGSTWLHEQLDNNVNINMGFLKEYHVFDTISLPEFRRWRDEIIHELLEKEKQGILGKNHPENSKLSKRLSFIDNTNNYFDYFDYLHYKDANTEAVGDITPSYALLTKETFKQIKDGLESRGFTVKVIFIMRDPVERAWSQTKMEKKNKLKIGIVNNDTPQQELQKIYKLDHVKKRTQYEKTISKLESVFTKENIFYGFYEELFTKEGYSALMNFLDINLKTPEFNNRINASAQDQYISIALAEEIAQYYEETYRFINDKFAGKASLLWPSATYCLN